MRMIGQIQGKSSAQLFSDYLYVQGIENEIESDDQTTWAIWVHSEEQLNQATNLFLEFAKNPANPEYKLKAKEAESKRQINEVVEEEAQKRILDGRTTLTKSPGLTAYPLTILLIILCILVSFLSNFGEKSEPISNLFISNSGVRGSSLINRILSMKEFFSGEIWRIFTPMLIHFGFIHLLFNMLWMKDLGGAVERQESSGTLAVLVLTIAALSNVAQFVTHGPSFGGMSGVVYGLLGYIWFRGRFDPFSGYFVPTPTLVLMGIWFFACLFGAIPNVANVVHGTGLIVGLVWGYLSAKFKPTWQQ